MADANTKSPGQLAIAVGEAAERFNDAILAASQSGLRVEIDSFNIETVAGPHPRVRAEVLMPLETRSPR